MCWPTTEEQKTLMQLEQLLKQMPLPIQGDDEEHPTSNSEGKARAEIKRAKKED